MAETEDTLYTNLPPDKRIQQLAYSWKRDRANLGVLTRELQNAVLREAPFKAGDEVEIWVRSKGYYSEMIWKPGKVINVYARDGATEATYACVAILKGKATYGSKRHSIQPAYIRPRKS